jgi:hypothetical protein
MAHSCRPAVEFFAIAQSAPLYSLSHAHLTLSMWSMSHRPCPEHMTLPREPGHVLSEQARPVHPALQRQSPSMHVPCGGEQPRGHTSTEQSAPRQPSAHLHLPLSHFPLAGEWQLLGHVVLAHEGGANPTRQLQEQELRTRSQTQWPRPWHPCTDASVSSAHAERPQSSPA